MANEEYGFYTFDIVAVKSSHSSCCLSRCVVNVLIWELGVSDQGDSK